MQPLELYTLNSLTKSDIVQGWDTLIWTERYSAWGDLQLKIPSTPTNRNLLFPTARLALNQSKYVMEVDTVIDSYDDNGLRMLDITGRSLESWMDFRVAMPSLTALATTPQWTLTGTPGAIVRNMFNTVCQTAAFSSLEGFPGLTSGTWLPHGSLLESTDNITVSLNPDTLYNSVKSICDLYNLGFRMPVDLTQAKLYFEVYTGEDRTSDQTVNPSVIFSADLQNLKDQKILRSSAVAKTVAYVFAQNGAMMVYAPATDQTAAGAQRRVLLVDASDITLPAGAALNTAMQQRGFAALGQNQQIWLFDGQISEYSPYTYGVDYNLGDIVEERDDTGYGNQMRVTEQIFVSDANGDRSYPTLTLNQVIVPGTWSSEPGTLVWSTVPSTEVWSNAT